jgi:hypothetical protein
MKRILIAACLAALSACAATPTPYQPYVKSDGGFTETQIETNRVRLTFKGNSLTDRETVETYMLYRAAEVTLANNFDYFVVADRATDAKSRTYGNYYGDPYFDSFPLRYRYYDPFWGSAWSRSFDTTTVTNYEASGEIAMFKGAKPSDKPEAFDARDVVKNLALKVKRPVAKS